MHFQGRFASPKNPLFDPSGKTIAPPPVHKAEIEGGSMTYLKRQHDRGGVSHVWGLATLPKRGVGAGCRNLTGFRSGANSLHGGHCFAEGPTAWKRCSGMRRWSDLASAPKTHAARARASRVRCESPHGATREGASRTEHSETGKRIWHEKCTGRLHQKSTARP